MIKSIPLFWVSFRFMLMFCSMTGNIKNLLTQEAVVFVDKPLWPLEAQVKHIIFNLRLMCGYELTCVAVFSSLSLLSSVPGCSDMVIHFEWHRTAMEQKSWSSLPLAGEDTGLEALASPLVGYLGKVSKNSSFLSMLSPAQS